MKDRDLRECRRLQRICLDLASTSSMEIERAGLLQVAEDCQRACDMDFQNLTGSSRVLPSVRHLTH